MIGQELVWSWRRLPPLHRLEASGLTMAAQRTLGFLALPIISFKAVDPQPLGDHRYT